MLKRNMYRYIGMFKRIGMNVCYKLCLRMCKTESR